MINRGQVVSSNKLDDAGEKLGGAVKDDWAGLKRERGTAEKKATITDLWPLPNWKKLIASLQAKHDPDYGALTYEQARETAATLCVARDLIIGRQKMLNGRGRSRFWKYYQDPEIVEIMRKYVAELQGYVTSMALMTYEEFGLPPAYEVFGFASMVADDDKAEAVLNAAGLGPYKNYPGSIPVSRETRLQQEAAALIEKGWPDVKVALESRKPALPRRPRLDKLERTGPDHRNGRDLHPDEIVAIFGLRGVEFGNWVRDDERQAAVNLAFEALHDFAEVLGIPPSGIGMWHKLGIGFGSRGRGSGPGGIGVAAHYESDRVVINLTRFNGDGSFAHELGHMFEHGLRDFVCGKGAEPFASAHWNYPNRRASLLANAEINAAFLTVMDVIMKREPNHEGAGWHRSPFLAEAHRLGRYWTKPLEMFARAFESYVFDWLRERGRVSQYLVHGVEGDRFDGHQRGNPYPTGEQRQRINAAMANLIGVWRAQSVAQAKDRTLRAVA
jgi:hypothetical protein